MGGADATGIHQTVFLRPPIEIEPKQGGAFILRMPDGRVDVKGKVVEWSPPHRLRVTWPVDWIEDMRNLPECLVTYEIAQAGESVRLTMTEAHSVGRAGRSALGRTRGLAGDPVEPEERARNRQAAASRWSRRRL